MLSKVNKIKKFYNNFSAPVKATMWFLICSIIQKCFSLISTPIYTRILSTSEYGKVANFSSWYELLYPFATLYISGIAYNNVLVKYENDKDKATFSLMTLTSCVTTGFFIIYLFWNNWFNKWLDISTTMMFFMFLQLLFVPVFDFWSAKERYDYKYKRLIIVTIGNTIATLVLSIVSILIAQHKYEARVVSGIFVIAATGIAIYLSTWKKAKGINIDYWGYALRISIPLIPHYLSMKILNQADRVMITKMVGVSETGIYSLAYTVSMLALVITDAINRSLCPYIYKKIRSKEVQEIRKTTHSVILLVLGAIVIEMFVAPELIHIFATKDYLAAIWIIPPVALSVFFIFIYVLFSNVEFYYEKTIFATLSSLFVAIVNVGLNYLFIRLFGSLAAGYTTLACYIIFALLHYLNYKVVTKKNADLSNVYDIKFIVILSVIGILCMLACLFLYRYTLIRWLIVIAIMLLSYIYRSQIIKVFKLK